MAIKYKYPIIKIISVLSVVALSGCQLNDALSNVNASLKQVNHTISSPMNYVDQSLSALCHDASLNEARTNQTYAGQGIKLSGRISDNLEAGAFSSSNINVDSSNVSVFLNKQGIDTNKLNNGQNINFQGVISHISNNYSGCSLHLDRVQIEGI